MFLKASIRPSVPPPWTVGAAGIITLLYVALVMSVFYPGTSPSCTITDFCITESSTWLLGGLIPSVTGVFFATMFISAWATRFTRTLRMKQVYRRLIARIQRRTRASP